MGLKGSMLLMSKASDSDSEKVVGETSGVAKGETSAIWNSILGDTKDALKNSVGRAISSTTTIRTWTRKRDDGIPETVTETKDDWTPETVTEIKKDFTIKPSKTGAKLGAIAGAAAGGVIGNYLPFIGGPICAAIGAIAGGIAGWIFGPA